MISALLAVIVFGLVAVFLSLQNDWLKKGSIEAKKAEEDRLYKLSVIKSVQEKIAYTTDPEKAVDEILVSLSNFFNYSTASALMVKNGRAILKIHVEDKISQEYVKKVEENLFSSFEKLSGKIPLERDKKIHGEMANDSSAKSDYLSSFHIPLIANNKVLALIHLSSINSDAFANTDDLRELTDTAGSSLTHFTEALNRETEKLSSLINSLDDGIFMVDNGDNLLMINDSAKKILGVFSDIDFNAILNVFPQDLNLENKIKEVILTHTPHFERGIQITDRAIDVFINPAGHDKVSVSLHDMTEYHKQDLRKEDFMHIMVHEMRSPATTIKDSAELIITSKDSLGEEKKAKFLEIIHAQAKKVLGQISSILDTAKLDAGKLVLQKTKGDIAKLINAEIQTFLPQAEKKNISLSFKTAKESMPEIYFDEIRIGQVIDNLLSNSLKFTPDRGKIQVEIDYETLPPAEDLLSLDKFVIISVSDNGVGISSEQQKFLFSKYTQAQNSSEEIAVQGTGLGLYLVKGIVEAHRGRIWVKSAQGQGTTFSFALPAMDIAKPTHIAENIPTTSLPN